MTVSSGLDHKIFPRLSAYLEYLPAGLESHPGCVVKAGVFRHFAGSSPLQPAQLAKVPEALRRLIEAPDSVGAWLPETQFMSSLLAMGDVRGLSEPEMDRWLLAANHELLGGRIYRGLMSMSSPELLLPLARFKWNTMRRGGTLFTVELGKKSCEATMRFPTRLFDRTCLLFFVPAFAALLEVSNATKPQIELGQFDDTSAIFRGRWE